MRNTPIESPESNPDSQLPNSRPRQKIISTLCKVTPVIFQMGHLAYRIFEFCESRGLFLWQFPDDMND